MKCSFCGNEVEPGAKFCSNCGTPVNEENPESTSGNESGDNQYGYSTGQSDYGYGQSDNGQSGYSYGQSDNSQSSYGYGQSDYGYGQSDNSQSSYGYDQSNNGQMNYGQPNYNQPNNGQSGKQVSGTPYMIFSILVTLCCCLPLGIVSIVYSSKINSLQKVGDYEGAQQAAKKARLFMIIGAVGGLIGSIALGVLGAFDSISNLGDTGSSIVSEDYDDVDDEDDVDDAGDEDKDSASTAKVTPSGELGEAWDSFTVQINDTVLTFPCSFSDVEGLGLTMDVDSTPEDYVVNKDEYELVFFDDANGHSLMFMACNNTEEAKKVKDCVISGLYVDEYDVEDGNLTIVFPGGVQIGANIDEVIAKWGEPDDVYEGEGSDSYSWYDTDTYNYCTVNVDQETKKVTVIDLDGQDL